MAGESVKEFTDATFDNLITKGIVIVDFHATWCGPCRMLAPVLEKVAGEAGGKITVGKIDIDKEMKVASRFQISSVPTMILFKEGKEIGRLVGLQTADAIKKWVGI
jgi:thioredoxin 1